MQRMEEAVMVEKIKPCVDYPSCPALQVCDWCQIVKPALIEGARAMHSAALRTAAYQGSSATHMLALQALDPEAVVKEVKGE